MILVHYPDRLELLLPTAIVFAASCAAGTITSVRCLWTLGDLQPQNDTVRGSLVMGLMAPAAVMIQVALWVVIGISERVPPRPTA